MIGEGLKLVVDVGVEHLNADIAFCHALDCFLVEALAHVVGLVLEALDRADDVGRNSLKEVVVDGAEGLPHDVCDFSNPFGGLR